MKNDFGVKIPVDILSAMTSFSEKIAVIESRFDKEAYAVLESLSVDNNSSSVPDELVTLQLRTTKEHYDKLLQDQQFRLQVVNMCNKTHEHNSLEVEGSWMQGDEISQEKHNKFTSILEELRSNWKTWQNFQELIFNEIRLCLQLYRFLGLEFIKSPDNVFNFVFKYINNNNPEDEYRIGLKMVDGLFCVNDCDPLIDDVERQVAELNHSNDFRTFILNIREKFCRLTC